MSAANPVTLPLSGYQAPHVALRGRRQGRDPDAQPAGQENPLTFDSYAEIVDLFRAAAKDQGVKAIVVTGAGGNFCSGGDVFEIIGPLTEMDTLGAARLHQHDRRAGQGDARSAAADRRRDRRRLRRRRRDHRHGVRYPHRHREGARSRSCSTASGLPAATWAPARSCRASSARAAPPNCCSPAAPWAARRPSAGASSTGWPRPRPCWPRPPSWRASLPTGPTFANAMTKRMLEMEWAMSVEQAIEAEAVAQALCMDDRGFRPRVPCLRRQTEAGVRGQLMWTGTPCAKSPRRLGRSSRRCDCSHGRSSTTAIAASRQTALGRRQPAVAAARRRRRRLPRAASGRWARRACSRPWCRRRTAAAIRRSMCARFASREKSWRFATGSPISPSPCRGSAPARSRSSAATELKRRYLPACATAKPSRPSRCPSRKRARTSRRSPPPPRPTAEMSGSTAKRPGSRTAASPTITWCLRAPARRPARAGLSAFMVDADTPGLTVAERIEVIAPHPLARLTFDGCRSRWRTGWAIPARASRSRWRRSIFSAPRWAPRRSASPAARCTRPSSTPSSRKLFGAPLADLQMTQGAIADSATEVDAAALLVYRAAWTKDVGPSGWARRGSPARRRWPRCTPPRRRSG